MHKFTWGYLLGILTLSIFEKYGMLAGFLMSLTCVAAQAYLWYLDEKEGKRS